MLRPSKQDVEGWISLAFFCFQILMILSLMLFFVVKTSGIRISAVSESPVNKRQISVQENLQALTQKMRSGEQRQRSLGEMKFFVFKIVLTAILFVITYLIFTSAVNSERVRSIRYRILIGHIMAFVIALFLPFLLNGFYWLFFTTFPSAFEILLTFFLITTVRYFSKSHIMARFFPLDLFLTGFTLWIVSFLAVIGFEAFLQNDFVTYPLKLMLIVGFLGGFGLNIFFLRKEI